MGAESKSNEIKITRIYNAPVKVVWDAWADPKQVAQWWGPRGFTLTSHSKDMRTGGTWHYTMHGPDGTDYENVAKYLEVDLYKRMVYDHGGSHDRPALFRVTVLFSETKGKTKMEMTMALPTPEAAEQTKKFIKAANGNSTWDRLAEYLDKNSTGKEKFVINRTFEASRDVLFKMWTDPNHFSKWLAPTGFNMEFLRADIKTGGKTFYCMSNDTGLKMYGRAEYREVTPPERLVYTQQFCDEHEKVSRHPMAPTWPETMQTTVTFHEEGPQQTRVVVEWEVVGPATAAEMETFIAGRTGMTQGWGGSFDKLDAYLAKN